MNPPFEPLPFRRPAVYMHARSHQFTCVACLRSAVGESPSAKYCKAAACQRVKAERSAARAKRRKG